MQRRWRSTRLAQPCGSVVAVAAVPHQLKRALQLQLLRRSRRRLLRPRRRSCRALRAAGSSVVVEGRGWRAAARRALRSCAAQARDFVAQPRARNLFVVAARREVALPRLQVYGRGSAKRA